MEEIFFFPCLLGAQGGVLTASRESCRAIKVGFIVIRIGTDNGISASRRLLLHPVTGAGPSAPRGGKLQKGKCREARDE